MVKNKSKAKIKQGIKKSMNGSISIVTLGSRLPTFEPGDLNLPTNLLKVGNLAEMDPYDLILRIFIN